MMGDQYDIRSFVVAAAVAVTVVGAGCGYAKIVEDIADDAGSRPIHDFQREDLEYLEKKGLTEVKEDYNTYLGLEDQYNERTNENEIDDLQSCMSGYVNALELVDKWDKDTMPGKLKACTGSTSCGGAKDNASGEVQKLGEKYYGECSDRQEEFMRARYRESLEGFTRAVPGTEWPLEADQYMTQLKVLRDDIVEAYGEDDELSNDYNSRIEELESGGTGQKLARYREFEKQQADLTNRMDAQLRKIQELKGELESAARDFEYARSAGARAKAERKHESLQIELHEAEEKLDEIHGEFIDRAAEAGITWEGDRYEATLDVHPGDTDGWEDGEEGSPQ